MKKLQLMWVRRVNALFLSQQRTWSALLMKWYCSLAVWADTGSGPEVSGRAVSHRSVQLADSGRSDWQAARGSVFVYLFLSQFVLETCNLMLFLFVSTVYPGSKFPFYSCLNEKHPEDVTVDWLPSRYEWSTTLCCVFWWNLYWFCYP